MKAYVAELREAIRLLYLMLEDALVERVTGHV